MIVADLIRELQTIDPSKKVFVSSDPEGNCITALDEVSESYTEDAESYIVELTNPDERWSHVNYEEIVVLWP